MHVGSWVIDGVSAGMGIRESSALVTNDLSRFVPHFFE
jgi:glutathionylspermidine synthase